MPKKYGHTEDLGKPGGPDEPGQVRHTPGPWTYVGKPYCQVKAFCKEGNKLKVHSIVFSDNSADAHLIAAAPEYHVSAKKLYEIAGQVQDCLDMLKDKTLLTAFQDAFSGIPAAIAKAEGRA